jgi:hypothetical protein
MMGIVGRAAAAAALARTLAWHPLLQAGIVLAPLALSPRFRAAARDAALEGAWRAGVAARQVVDRMAPRG